MPYSKAAILAVGTELTTGQVTNRNAAWIADKLTLLGVEVILHETVADDHQIIIEALNRCAQSCQLLFVTGGLGPTTDDFTRNVIADWIQAPLVWDEGSWQKIHQRLTYFGVPIAESNRQQAYFPQGSQILANSQGTADGFTLPFISPSADKAENNNINYSCQIWVFPGPPLEVKTVWEQGVENQIQKIVPDLKPDRLFTWQCLGKSESELGEITEKALLGSGLKTGYRAHRPIVEVKVWCPLTQVDSKQKWLDQLDQILAPWVLTRQGENLGHKLLQFLKQSETIEIIDAATGGMMAQRIGTLLRDPEHSQLAQNITLVTEWGEWSDAGQLKDWVTQALGSSNESENNYKDKNDNDDATLSLALAGVTTEGRGIIGVRNGGKIYQEFFQVPYTRPEALERARSFTVELALKYWCKCLDTLAH